MVLHKETNNHRRTLAEDKAGRGKKKPKRNAPFVVFGLVEAQACQTPPRIKV